MVLHRTRTCVEQILSCIARRGLKISDWISNARQTKGSTKFYLEEGSRKFKCKIYDSFFLVYDHLHKHTYSKQSQVVSIIDLIFVYTKHTHFFGQPSIELRLWSHLGAKSSVFILRTFQIALFLRDNRRPKIFQCQPANMITH